MNNQNSHTAFYEKAADRKSYLYFEKVSCGGKIATTPHFHDSIELVMSVKGQSVIYINGVKNVINEGESVFIDRFDVHYYKYLPGSIYYVFLVSEKYLDSCNGFDKKRLPTFLPATNKSEVIKMLLSSAYSLWKNSNETYRTGLVNVILGAFSDEYGLVDREYKSDSKVLLEAMRYINENFTEDITLEFLSDKFCYSKNYFSALFNRFAGMNLRDYINRRRLSEFERIKRQNPDLPVYAAAQQSGFGSLKTFYRVYNKYNGGKS